MSIVHAPLDATAARVLTEEIKGDAAALWTKLLRAYEGGAHTALGYSSWGAYYEAEFGESKSQGYRVLDSARVVEALAPHSPNGGLAPPTSVLEENIRAATKRRFDFGAFRDTIATELEQHGTVGAALRAIRARKAAA